MKLTLPFISSLIGSAMTKSDVILKFKTGSPVAERTAALDAIKAQGGAVKSTDNLESSIFPFAVVTIDDEQFTSLQAASLDDKHDVIENVGGYKTRTSMQRKREVGM
ncbi:uncharacterized protein EHS24_004591 [Apiotrichum porosum]|uniref:Inhibitor I9 domain-containing protein n=1 Tax=Apiotrichum porosum TaxID=105984 RepID=A0A427Y5J6_9TREE|nr:uncharacterized protein EHS24_004591 [Apiotrichum porosum]RSH86344.1 hypothetical protein EHS24_004591 [Apiotrichum porosum]